MLLKGSQITFYLFHSLLSWSQLFTGRCGLSEIEGFKSGKLPLRAPSERYAKTLVRGLVEGKQLSEEEAMAYIQEASTKPL